MLVLRAQSKHTIYNIFSVCFSSQDNPLHEERRENIYLRLVERLRRKVVVFVVLQCKLWQGWWPGLMQVSRKMIDETEPRRGINK